MNRLYSKLFSILLLLNGLPFGMQGQHKHMPGNPDWCGTMSLDSARRLANPKLGTTDEFEKWLAPLVDAKKTAMMTGRVIGGVYTIPTVVHVVHNGEAIGTGRNISVAQIQSQIDVLNEDFRKKIGSRGHNTHPNGADTRIEFCLAQRDPAGAPSTGIVRWNRNTMGWTAPPHTMAYINSTIKPATFWDPDRYFNLWVMDLGSGLLGYAQFPDRSGFGGIPYCSQAANTDGCVINYTAFGSSDKGTFPVLNPAYDLGRTTTHEVGHWLGLRHIWGDAFCGTDYCGDTPTHETSNSGCPTHPKPNACGTADEMFENYMDYCNDNCLNIFTFDQAVRMRVVLENSPRRAGLLISPGCVPPFPNDAALVNIIAPLGEYCAAGITPTVTIRNFGSANLTSCVINYQVDAGPVSTQAWTGSLASLASANVTLPAITVGVGGHSFRAWTTLPNGVADPAVLFDTTEAPFSYSPGAALPYSEDFEGNSFPPASWQVQNPTNDCYTWRVRPGMTGATGTPTKAAFMYLSEYGGSGQIDHLISPLIDLTVAAGNATLLFDVAYRRQTTANNDNLQVYVSTNCGTTWTSVFSKTGATLQTVATTTTADWQPTASTQWRREIVNLTPYVGSKIKLRFTTTNNNGNNLYVDNVQVQDKPVVAFVSPGTTVSEQTVSTLGCRGYRDWNIPMSISFAPAAAVTATISTSGSAINPADFEILTPTVVFPAASTANQNLTFRIYDDAAVETPENINITFTLTPNATVSPTAGSHTITINDNDVFPPPGVIYSEDFESSGGVFPAGWTITGSGTNTWVVGNNGGMTGTYSAYITQNTTTKPLTYNNTATSLRRLRSPAISTIGRTNLQLSFLYKCNGEDDGTTKWDFGRLMYATAPTGPYTPIFGPADAATNTTGPAFCSVTANTNYTVNLPVACENQAALYLVWRWDNDNNTGTNPPFAIDDIVLQGSILPPIATTITSTDNEYLGPNSTVYYYNTAGRIIAKLQNNSTHDFGCTTVQIDRVGTSASVFNAEPNPVTDKTILITPTNPSTSANFTLTLYYTKAEIEGWELATGQPRSVIKIFNTDASITANNPAGATYGTGTIRGAYGTDSFFVQADFNSGMGGFGGRYDVVSNTITTGAVTPLSLCAGGTINVPFTITGSFVAGNVFTVQLSDASGSFAAPTNLTPTLSSTTASTMTVTIPGATPIGTGYRVRVISSSPAVIGSSNSADITINSLPAAPVSVAASSIGCTGFTANWNTAAGASTYTLDVATDAGFASPITGSPFVGLTGTSQIISGLTAGTTYYYRVRGVNGCGSSANSGTITVTTNSLPAAPVSVAASSIGCTGFTANWNTAAGASTYTLDVATDAGFVSPITGSPFVGLTGTSQIISGLTAGTTYYYRVRGVNGCGSSANSGTITVTTNSLPAAPVSVAASSIGCTGFTANWNTAAGASTYTLDVATDAGFVSPITGSPFVGLTGTSQIISGLTAGTTYYYRVRGVNGCGSSANSGTIIVTTNSLPAAPVSVAASSIGCTGFTANWNAVVGSTDYRLDVATDAGFVGMLAGYNDLSVGVVTSFSVTGLTAGTTYYYRVRSVSSCGTSVNSTAITVTTNSLPAAPVSVAASSIGCTGFTANWNTAAGASTYTLDVATDAGFASPITGSPFVGLTGTSQIISGLTAGTTYYYRVRGVNGCGSSANSGTIIVMTNSLPAAPVSVAASSIGCTGFTANWNAVVGSTDYRLDVATDAGFVGMLAGYNDLSVGVVTSFSVTGLTAGTIYYYRVRSVSSCGTSVNSTAISVTTNSLPAAPVSVAASSIGCTGFTANWNTAAGASTYTLDVATDAGFVSPITGSPFVGITGTSQIISGLTAGTTYYYRVRGVNGCGSSANSGTIIVTTNSLPAAPVSVAASSIGCTGFTANWNTAAGASTYTLDVATDAGFVSPITGSPFVGLTGTSQIISGLTGGTTYYYRVRGVNGCGSSANSGTIIVTTNSLPAAPVSIAASGIGCTGFTANWNTAAGASTYTLDVATDAGFVSPITGSPFVGITGTSQIISGLTAGTTYYYRVRGVNGCGSSANSGTIIVTTNSLPAAPVSVAASSIGCTGFTANWNTAAGASTYTLDVATDAGFVSPITGSPFVGITGTSQIISGLTAGTTYYYRVRGVNGCGSSVNSGTITVMTNSLPAVPVSIAASGIGCTGFTANWNAATGASTYTLDVATDAGFVSPITGSPFVGITGTSQIISGLTAGTTYYYRVRGVNGCGSSANSGTITVTTNSLPAAPVSVAASSIGCTGFTANWNAVVGSTDYRLDVATDAGFVGMLAGYNDLSVGVVTSFSVTGLTAGTTYYYRVRSVSSCGTSVNSTAISVTTNSLPAAPVSVAASSIGCTGFTANWNTAAGASTYTLDVATDAGFVSPITGSPFVGLTGTSQIISGLTAGTTYYYRVRGVNGCGSSANSGTITVTTNSLPALVSITGPSPVTAGSSQTYSVTPGGYSSYNWVLPAGWVGSSSTHTITATVGSLGGSISVTATDACGTSSPVTLNVVVNSVPPTPGPISGLASVCQNAVVTYSVSPVTGATGYTWTLPSGWVGSSTSNTITVTVGTATGAGTISVTADNGSGSSAPQTLAVFVNALPTVSGGPVQLVCIGSVPVALTGFSPVGGVWSGSPAVSAGGIFDPSLATVGITELIYTYTDANGCTKAAVKSVQVVAEPVVNAGISPINVCSDAPAFNLSGFAPFGGVWSGSPGVSAAGNFDPSVAGIGTHTLTYTFSDGYGCTASDDIEIIVAPAPKTNFVLAANSPTVCKGSDAKLLLTGSQVGVNYQLVDITGANVGSSIAGTGDTLRFTVSAAALVLGANTFKVIATRGICSSPIDNAVTITVVPSPQTGFTLISKNVCVGTPTFIELSGSEPGFNYQLVENVSNSMIGSAVAGNGLPISFPIASLSTTTSYRVIVSGISGGCNITLTTVGTLTVLPAPDVSIAARGDTVCSGLSGIITLSSSQTGVSYQLKRTGTTINVGTAINGTGSSIQFSVPAGNLVIGNNVFTVYAGNGGCEDTLSVPALVRVANTPDFVGISVVGSKVCQGQAGIIELSSSQIGVSYRVLSGGNPIGSVVVGTGGKLTLTVPAPQLAVGNNDFIVQAFAGACTSAAVVSARIEVLASPSVAGLTASAEPICRGDNGLIVLTGTVPGVSYQVSSATRSFGISLVASSSNLNFVIPAAELVGGFNLFEVEVVNAAGCIARLANPVNVTAITLNLSGVSLESEGACEGRPGRIIASGTQPGLRYQLVTYPDLVPVGPAQIAVGNNLNLNVPAALLAAGTVNYTVTVTRFACTKTLDTQVVVLTKPVPPAPNVIGAKRCGIGPVVLQASGSGELRWYNDETATRPVGFGTAYTITALTSSQTFYVAVVVDGCESKRAKVEAVVLPVPEVKLKTSANNIFVGERATLAVENPVAGTQYSWWLNGTKIWEGTELDMNFPNPGVFNFIVKAVDNLLCEGESAPLEVRVNSQIAASYFTGTPVEGIAPHRVQFSANSPAGTTAWLWEFGDSTANSTEENPIHEYQSPGRYSVTLQRTTQGITYVESRAHYIIVKTTTGVLPEINNSFSFRMYPNPARDRVYIQTDRTDIPKLLIGIYDMAGKEITTQTIIGQSGEVSLNGLAAGVYTLRVNGVSVRLTVE